MATSSNVFRLGSETRADPAIYEALGRLIDNWNGLEAIARTLITTMLEADSERIRIALSAMQTQSRLNVLRALVLQAYPEKADAFHIIWTRIERAQRYRNQAAHSEITGLHGLDGHHWVDDRVRISKSGAVTIGSKQRLTAHSLKRRATYVRAVGLSLLGFMGSFKHPEWHAKNYPQRERVRKIRRRT